MTRKCRPDGAGRARNSVLAVVANPRAMVAIGGGQRTARPTNRNAVAAFSPALERWWPCASTNAFRVDELVGTVSQGRRWWPIRHGSPAGADANPGLMDLNPVGIRGMTEFV